MVFRWAGIKQMAKNNKNLIVGLDIGTSSVKTIIASINEDNEIDFLGKGSAKSLGMKRGMVIDIHSTVQSIKKSVGSAMQMNTKTISVRGRDLVTGIPKTIEVSSDEIRQALKDPVNAIVEAVKRCLEQTPPELAADILERGIIVAGGGSLLRGIDQIIRERTNVPVNVAEDPLLSVVKGTGMVLENLKKYEAVLL